MQKYHHYCKGRIATQYCSFTAKKNVKPVEWFAQHDETHFDSFNKLCFALNHDMSEHYSRAQLRGSNSLNVQIYYLILVVIGEIIDIVPMRKEIKLRNTSHIHYVQSYITGGTVDNYHIDVVTEKYLPRLLKQIDVETKRTVQLLRRHRKIIQGSISPVFSGP